jgi:hypothetical protein
LIFLWSVVAQAVADYLTIHLLAVVAVLVEFCNRQSLLVLIKRSLLVLAVQVAHQQVQQQAQELLVLLL